MKIKKIFGIILVLVILVGLVSCTNNASIVGSWQYKGKDADVEAKQQETVKVIKEQYATHNEAEQFTLSFSDDSTFTITSPQGYTDNGAYTYQNGMLTLSSKDFGGDVELIVVVKGNTLKLGVDIVKHPNAVYPSIDLKEAGITTYIEYEVYERIK